MYKKKLIARLSNGFGNQMFLYASSYAIAKRLGRELELDIVSGIKSLTEKNKKKKFKHFNPKYELNIFNIKAKINSCCTFDTFVKKIKRKILIFFDFFLIKKKFIIEHKNENKFSYFKNNYDNYALQDIAYIEGYFESEKYFKHYKKDLKRQFTFNKKIYCNQKYKKKILKSNSVSMAIRADRFNERMFDDLNENKIKLSKNFEKLQFDYIIRSMDFFKKKIKNPEFFIFSDNTYKIKKLFIKYKNVNIIDNYINNKIIEDFYLMSLCKHFAVAPTSFHFWPAWLSDYKSKICLRPKNINPSKNRDYWPDDWVEI